VKAAPKKVEHQCGHTTLIGEAEARRDDATAGDEVGTLALPYVDHDTGEVVGGYEDAEIVDGEADQ
jgi:hypothetical protein